MDRDLESLPGKLSIDTQMGVQENNTPEGEFGADADFWKKLAMRMLRHKIQAIGFATAYPPCNWRP